MAFTDEVTAAGSPTWSQSSGGEAGPVIGLEISQLMFRAAQDMMVFRPLITEVPFTGPGGQLDLIKWDGLTASSYTEAAQRTFTPGAPTDVSFNPSEVDVAMAFTDKARRRSQVDLVAQYSPAVTQAIALKVDADIADLADDLSITDVDEGASAASIAKVLEAITAVRVAAKDQVGMPSAVLHTSLWDDILLDAGDTTVGQNRISSVDVRGAGNALMSGSITLLGGASIHFTTAVITGAASPAKYQNPVFTKRSIALVWKSLLDVDVWDDRDVKSIKIGASADYDVGTFYAGEGVPYTVTV